MKTDQTVTTQRPAAPPRAGFSVSTAVLIGVLLLVAVLRPVLGESLLGDGVSAWATIFTAMFVQAVPFLVLGVTIQRSGRRVRAGVVLRQGAAEEHGAGGPGRWQRRVGAAGL